MRRMRLASLGTTLLLGMQTVSFAAGDALLDRAFERGVSCLASDLEEGRFRDPYLRFVYPGEALPAPPGRRPLTYRQVDAAAILSLIGRTGPVPEPLATVMREARADLAALAPVWRGRGFSNTARDPRPDGIALDTYCIVGWLNGDIGMAAEAAAAIEGDRWLLPKWYDDAESYRAPADEAWCLRLLASTSRFHDPASRVLDRIVTEWRQHRREDPGGTAAYYEAWHLEMVVSELLAHGSAADPRWMRLSDEIADGLRAWAEAHAAMRAAGDARRADLLEWINLVTAERIEPGLRLQAAEVLLATQEGDGCWRIPGGRHPNSATSFTTLRGLLALRRYGAALEESRGGGSRPAP